MKTTKKTIISFFLLSALGFVLTSCMKDNDSVYYMSEEPAIVHYQDGEPMIQTYYGIYSAPNIVDSLVEGDCLWINYTVIDERNKSASGAVFASGLDYERMDSAAVGTFREGDLATDSYTGLIDRAVLYKHIIGNMLFFGFEQKAPKGEKFHYKIMYNPEETGDDIPTLYIRSSGIQSSGGEETKVVTRFAFDMKTFVDEYKGSGNRVQFNVKYLSGKDEHGEDVYTAFQSNPISWQL